MGLQQPQVALLVPDDSLLPIARAKNYSDEQYEPFFIRDKYGHLTICLRLMEPHSLCTYHFLPQWIHQGHRSRFRFRGSLPCKRKPPCDWWLCTLSEAHRIEFYRNEMKRKYLRSGEFWKDSKVTGSILVTGLFANSYHIKLILLF